MALLAHLLRGALVFALGCAAAPKQPNILFILTDDQDWHMRSLVRHDIIRGFSQSR
jgi:N-acetylglucosamine-6-sulfatase